MQKIMILPACLGILLVGIVMIPGVFAQEDGCGTGTVLVDGVCQLAPQESNDGCGAGTVMVNGVCQLDKSSGGSIPPLYIAGGATAIGAAIIGIIFAVKRGSSGTTTKPAKQDLDDYESKYIAKQDVEPSPKPAETKPTSSSCTVSYTHLTLPTILLV